MRKRSFLGLLVVCFLAFLTVPAWAQGETHKRIYTYVSEWGVPRSMWPEMAKIQAEDHEMLNRFLADGTITSYGDFVNLVHQEGGATHGGWFQSSTISGILRVLAAFAALPRTTSPVLSASKHWDYFLLSDADEVGARSGIFTGAYLRVETFRLKPGQEETFENLHKTFLQPVYKQWMADGALVYYGLESDFVQSRPGGTVDVVIIAANAEALDKAVETFQAAFEKNPAVFPALFGTIELGSFRSYLSVVSFAKFK